MVRRAALEPSSPLVWWSAARSSIFSHQRREDTTTAAPRCAQQSFLPILFFSSNPHLLDERYFTVILPQRWPWRRRSSELHFAVFNRVFATFVIYWSFGEHRSQSEVLGKLLINETSGENTAYHYVPPSSSFALVQIHQAQCKSSAEKPSSSLQLFSIPPPLWIIEVKACSCIWPCVEFKTLAAHWRDNELAMSLQKPVVGWRSEPLEVF